MKRLLLVVLMLSFIIGVLNAQIFWENEFKNPKDAAEAIKKMGLTSVKVPKDFTVQLDIVAGVVFCDDGRIIFDPLLSHHMAVEYWFVKNKDVFQKLAKDTRYYARVEGDGELFGYFSPWPENEEYEIDKDSAYRPWGDGLKPGGYYSGVWGYHERIYTINITKIHYIITVQEYRELRRLYQKYLKEARNLVKEHKVLDAQKIYIEVEKLAKALGFSKDELESELNTIYDMAYIINPKNKEDADYLKKCFDIVVKSIAGTGEYYWEWNKIYMSIVREFIENLNEDDKQKFIAEVMKQYYELDHLYQKRKIQELLKEFDKEVYEKLMEEIKISSEKRNENWVKFDDLIKKGNFEQLLELAKENAKYDAVCGISNQLIVFKLAVESIEKCIELEGYSNKDRNKFIEEIGTTIESDIMGRSKEHEEQTLIKAVKFYFFEKLNEKDKEKIEDLIIELLEKKLYYSNQFLRAARWLEEIATEKSLKTLEAIKTKIKSKMYLEPFEAIIARIKARLNIKNE